MGGHLMNSRNCSFASVVMACVLAVGFLGIAPGTNTASAGQSSLKDGESVKKGAKKRVAGIKRRGRRTQKIYLPIGPSSTYYDYAYFYSRGHYPTHIGGYVYYHPRLSSRMRYGRYGLPITRRVPRD